jgi:hypothetical protein
MRGIMPGRLLRLSVLALVGGLMAVLVGHMWGRYSQQADASGLERYLGAYVVPASKDLEPYQSAEGRARAAGARLKFSEPAIGSFDVRLKKPRPA